MNYGQKKELLSRPSTGLFFAPAAMQRVLFLLLICSLPVIYARDSANVTDWLYFSATSGYHWPGWVYRLPLDDLSASIEQLEFTVNVTAFVTSPQYLYWGYGIATSGTYVYQIGRATHDGSEIIYDWLTFNDTSGCRYGGMYGNTWRFDYPTNSMWYQASYDLSYCSLDLSTMKFTNYGTYRSPGNGGFNGGINLYRNPPQSENVTGFVYGLDMGQLYSSTGALMYAALDNAFRPGKNGTLLSTAFQFPRATGVIPGTTLAVVGGYNNDGNVAVIDVPTKTQTGLFTPSPSPTDPCAAAADPLTGDIYFGMPGANGDAGGVFLLPYNLSTTSSSGTFSRVVDPTSLISCMACFCYVSVVRGNVPTPSPPVIEAISPQNGSVSGGYPVYLWGSNFQNSTSLLLCQFGHSKPVEGVLLAPALVECIAPESPVAGSTKVRASNDGGQTWSQQNIVFTYIDDKKRHKLL
jgi:hypothetical protein